MQKLLTGRGYDVGEPDGAIGKKTKDAIADFRARTASRKTAAPPAKCSRPFAARRARPGRTFPKFALTSNHFASLIRSLFPSGNFLLESRRER